MSIIVCCQVTLRAAESLHAVLLDAPYFSLLVLINHTGLPSNSKLKASPSLAIFQLCLPVVKREILAVSHLAFLFLVCFSEQVLMWLKTC